MQRNVRFMIVNANRFIGQGCGIGYFETCGLTIAKNRIKTALSIHIPYLTIRTVSKLLIWQYISPFYRSFNSCEIHKATFLYDVFCTSFYFYFIYVIKFISLVSLWNTFEVILSYNLIVLLQRRNIYCTKILFMLHAQPILVKGRLIKLLLQSHF